MKKALSLLIAVVMVATLAASAFATASPSLPSPGLPGGNTPTPGGGGSTPSPSVPGGGGTPSPSVPGGTPSPSVPGSGTPAPAASEMLVPAIVGAVAYDADGNVVEVSGTQSISIVNEAVKADAKAEVAAALDAAIESLKATTIDALIPELAGMVVSDVLYIDASDDVAAFLANGGTITITLDMKVEAGTEMNAIVYKDAVWSLVNDTWDTAVTVEDNGDVNLTINQLGVYALLSK